jgi:hypothetical protein
MQKKVLGLLCYADSMGSPSELTDLLPLEGEVRRNGQRRGKTAEATGRRESEAEARGGRADAAAPFVGVLNAVNREV